MWVRRIIGIVLLALGGVWIAQGSGTLHGSLMTGEVLWTVIGVIVGLFGIALLVGTVRDKTVVFGHSHLQFRRAGPNGTTLINPGSAGMPLDGDVRAAYALRHDDGVFEFRRVEYDIERAARAWDRMPGSFGQFAGRRLRRGSD